MPNVEPEEKAAAVVLARRHAIRALENVLDNASLETSEQDIHGRWHTQLVAYPELASCGWYLPPPLGMSVLIGDPPDFGRVNFRSLRDATKWPSVDIGLGQNKLVFVYCSPVHLRSLMIGDFQTSLYGGESSALQDHIAASLAATTRIVNLAEVGMEFRDLYALGISEMRKAGVRNDTHSSTDRSGETNIGHTVPWFNEEPSQAAQDAMRTGNREHFAASVSTARLFITAQQGLRIAPISAFTVEPQLVGDRAPLVSFHFIVIFVDGVKTVLAGFSRLFEMFNMTRYLPSEVTSVLEEYDQGARAWLARATP